MLPIPLTLFVILPPSAGEWTRLAPLPNATGVAGAFAGVSNGALVVAGGANFPDKKPWDGGKKVWHDAVYVLEKPDGKWVTPGKLPRPLAYGVSVTHRGGVVCVGGSDATRHHADAVRLEWADGKLVTTPLPPLPKPAANMTGVLLDDVLYVVGGQEKPEGEVTRAVWRIDLAAKEPEWEPVDPLPGRGRILAVAAAFDGKICVAGGAEVTVKDGIAVRHYLKDAYDYEPTKGWGRLVSLPHPVVGAPSPAPADAVGFTILGGDDGSQMGAAPDAHRGFRKTVLRFDAKSAQWVEAGTLAPPRVTTPCVVWEGSWVIPSGEVRPGVRSPEVWRFTPKP